MGFDEIGHQIISQALGGRVEHNSAGLQAARCDFDVTALGASLGLGDGTAALQYHHNDCVTRLPPCAANLGCSASCPAHASALFASPTTSRMAVSRGVPADPPIGITLQGHPEFSTPAGAAILLDILHGEEGGAERYGDSARDADGRTAAQAHKITRAVMGLLWPKAFAES